MHLFSRALLGIYGQSTRGSLQEFHVAAASVLHECFKFDAVVLGASRFYEKPGLYILSAHLDGLPHRFIDDYLPLLSRDPIMQFLLSGLERPLRVDLHFYYQNLHLSALANFAHQYGLRQMMVFGDTPQPGHPTRWIMLFAHGPAGFTSTEQKRLANLWPHLSQATSMCDAREAMLRNLVPPPCGGSALLNDSGELKFAELRFLELLRLEWPECDIPGAVQLLREQLLPTHSFRGKCIEITMAPESGHVCQARPTAASGLMTPREALVARRFAAGLSHKEVARELGISPHTVRTQLTHIYSKLQLHDKGALANYLLAQSTAEAAALPN